RPAAACITQLHLLAPEPGTPLFARLAAELRYDGRITDTNSRPLDDRDQQLIVGHPEIFATYHYYATVLDRVDHCFAAEFVELVHGLGHEVTTCLLECFGDIKLSELAALLRNWLLGRKRPLTPTPADLIDLVSEALGPESLGASLVRFGFAIADAREQAEL